MSGIINSAGSKSGVIGQTELDYEEYIAPSTACTGGLTLSIVWTAVKVGNMICVIFPHFYGVASNTQYIELGHTLPTQFRPKYTCDLPVTCAIKSNVRFGLSMFRAQTNGVMRFYAGIGTPSDAWGTGNPTGIEYSTSYSWPNSDS